MHSDNFGPATATTRPTTGPPTQTPTPTPAEAVATGADTPPDLNQRPGLVVVAVESAGELAVVGPASDPDPCRPGGSGSCGPLRRLRTIKVPPRPHNLAATGSVVLATHPAAGEVSRLDLVSGQVTSADVGVEPHDVKFASANLAYVADEAWQKLLAIDSRTLKVRRSIAMPGPPHDLLVAGDSVWVTIVGSDTLLRVRGDTIERFPTGRSPHDLIMDRDGRIWFSNWRSDELASFDPSSGESQTAPAGVVEPHHFAVSPDGAVWVSDNGGNAIVGFHDGATTKVQVGPNPHHLAAIDGLVVVAVSGAGTLVVVRDDQVVGRVALARGLHGVATASPSAPIQGPAPPGR